MLRIGRDLDGPHYNFGDSVRRYLDSIGRTFGWKDNGPEPHHWNFYEYWQMTLDEFKQICNDGADAGYIFCGPIREGAKESWLRDMQYGDTIVITDRQFGTTPEVSEKNTVEWLRQHGLYYDELWFTADKTVTPTDIMIEDKIENYDALENAGTESWLINYPWNQVEGGDNRRRVDTMSEFSDRVRALYRKRTSSFMV